MEQVVSYQNKFYKALISGNSSTNVFGQIAHRREYEEHITYAIAQLVEEDFVCIDAGANIGLHTLGMAFAAPKGQVFAFEPVDENIDYLKANTQQNNLNNVTIVSQVLCDKVQTQTIFLHPEEKTASASFKAQDGFENQQVTATTLDSWFSNNPQLDRLDFIKIDTDGHETEIIEGGWKSICTFKPTIIIELAVTVQERQEFGRSRALVDRLSGIYPHRYWLTEFGEIIPFEDYGSLIKAISLSKGVEDLLFSNHPLPSLGLDIKRRCRNWLRKKKRAWLDREFCILQPDFTIATTSDQYHAATSQVFSVDIQLSNRCFHHLASNYRNPVNISYHIVDSRGETVVFDGLRTPLKKKLAPGQTIAQSLRIASPAQPGTYRVDLTLVQEGFAWFEKLAPGLIKSVQLTVT